MPMKNDGTIEEFSLDHERMLYLISKYSKTAHHETEKDVWIKELPLLAIIHYGILDQVFNYDYAPASVELQIGRKFLNLSQEGIDNIEDLREFGYIDCLKLSSTSYLFLNGYKINNEGIRVLNGEIKDASISEGSKKAIDELITCKKCGSLITVDIDLDFTTHSIGISLACSDDSCNFKVNTGMDDIEDVSYKSVPYLPRGVEKR